MNAKHSEFVALVESMRALGATRVRCGDMEAAFAGPQPEPEAPKGKPGERVSLSTAEMDELDQLRDMRRRAEELGVEV